MKTALIFGSSGLIGSELLNVITQNNNYNKIKLFVRSVPEIKDPKIESQPVHIMDIPATCFDAAEAQYPTEFDGNIIKPLEGESFLKLLKTSQWKREKPMYWEHEGNQGIRKGEWKLVREYGKGWELYNIIEDRTELNDLSSNEKDIVKEMSKEWENWAKVSNVLPWPVDPNVVAKRLKGDHSHIHQHRGPKASDLKMGKGKFL